jgi:hypothetical protein
MDIMPSWPDVNHPAVPKGTITGRYLAHAKHTREQWAFIGAELVLGRRRLVHPTEVQAAFLAHNINRSAVHWALRRLNERTAIEAGVLPLVPSPALKALPAPVTAQAKLADVVAEIGVGTAYEILNELKVLAQIEALDRTAPAA